MSARREFNPRANGVCPADSDEVKLLLDVLSKAIWDATKNALSHKGVKENIADESFCLVDIAPAMVLNAGEIASIGVDIQHLQDKCQQIASLDSDCLDLDKQCAGRIRRNILSGSITVKFSNLVDKGEIGRDKDI
jgi:hypothetical protein